MLCKTLQKRRKHEHEHPIYSSDGRPTTFLSVHSVPQLMLVGAVMGQLGIAMIVLSRVLKYTINRWVNIVVAVVTVAYIWGGMASYPHYLFIAIVESLCLLLIIWFAWAWRHEEGQNQGEIK